MFWYIHIGVVVNLLAVAQMTNRTKFSLSRNVIAWKIASSAIASNRRLRTLRAKSTSIWLLWSRRNTTRTTTSTTSTVSVNSTTSTAPPTVACYCYYYCRLLTFTRSDMVSGATRSVPSLPRVKRRAVAVVFEIIWLPTITITTTIAIVDYTLLLEVLWFPVQPAAFHHCFV